MRTSSDISLRVFSESVFGVTGLLVYCSGVSGGGGVCTCGYVEADFR